MTAASVDRKWIRVTFADEARAVVPFSDVPEIGSIDNLAAIDLPNPYEVILSSKRGEVVELPWDFFRLYCDAAFVSKEEAMAAHGSKTLGKRLRQLRESAEMTQEGLATAASIGRATIARVENGEQSPRYATLQSIAEGLGCPIEALLVDQKGLS